MFRLRALGVGAAASCVMALAITVPSASQAAEPHATVAMVRGIDTYVTYDCVSASQMDSWARNEANAYKSLGATEIGIGFPLYTPSINSNEIYAKSVCGNQEYQSPPASILAGIVQAAQAAGLKVLLRPLLDQTNLFEENPTYWRGVIAPTNLSTWMTNYLTTLRPYLIMAQQNHVASFAIQTELDSIASAPNWTGAINLVKDLYSGSLVWDYSWLSKPQKITQPGTSFAVDAYPKMPQLKITATPTQIAQGWTGVDQISGYKLPAKWTATTFDEVGIQAQDGAYANPSQNDLPLSTNPFNEKIQANWFTGACTFAKNHHLAGIFFWGPYLTANDGRLLTSPDENRTDNIQPLAQKAIKKCF